MKTKVFLTTLVTLTFGIVEWKMWHFFRHELKEFNPPNETITLIFILWGILGVGFAALFIILIVNIWIWKPQGKGNHEEGRKDRRSSRG